MSDEEEDNKEKKSSGAPKWMATFADLMSLLLAFFVLLFAMSSIDETRYKIVGGSLREAFGVQRFDHRSSDPILGVNMIAMEFSSGRPDPTILNVVPQKDLQVDLMRVRSENISDTPHPHPRGGELRGSADTSQRDQRDSGAPQTDEESTISDDKATPAEARESEAVIEQDISQAAAEDEDTAEAAREDAQPKESDAQRQQQQQQLDHQDQGVLPVAALMAAQDNQAARRIEREIAQVLRQLFKDEQQEGTIEIEIKEGNLILRLADEGLFPAGSAEPAQPFVPLVEKMSDVLRIVEGKVTVAGHSDSIPIRSPRFRSNWELSASRAVTVVQGLLDRTGRPSSEFEVHGYGDSRPIADNRTPEGRAKNRRVEVIVELDQIVSTLPERLRELVQEPEAEPELEPEEIAIIEDSERVEKAIQAIPEPIFNRPRDTDGRPDFIFGPQF